MLGKNKISKERRSDGFALFYALLIIGVMLTATSIFLETALEELFISKDRSKSDRAFYMAEAGIECAIHNHIKNRVFNMRKERRTYHCNDNVEFEAGWKDDEFESSYSPGSLDGCYWDENEIIFTGLLDHNPYENNEGYKILGDDLIEPFVIWDDNDEACTRVFVKVESVKRSLGGVIGDIVSCDVSVTSVGASKCESDGSPAEGSVERTRIENF